MVTLGKRVRVNSSLNDIYEFEPKISIIDVSIINDYFSKIKDFNQDETIRSCINKFKTQIDNILNKTEVNKSYDNHIKKLNLKLIHKNIKNNEELSIYIDEYYEDLIYDSCIKFANYQLTYILHELNKIKKKIKDKQLYIDELIKLNNCIKILLYYIFKKSIYEVEKEEEALLNSYNKKIRRKSKK